MNRYTFANIYAPNIDSLPFKTKIFERIDTWDNELKIIGATLIYL